MSKSYSALGGAGALLLTYLALLILLTGAAAALQADVPRFAVGFSIMFWIAYASWIIGSNAHIAAVTLADLQKFGIRWSLKLTNESGYIVALLAGLFIANFVPRFAEWLREAVRPELYIKVAIVILGCVFAVTAAGKLNLATSLLLRGTSAIIEAYLIYWAVVYFDARKYFGFNRECAVPLPSGISIFMGGLARALGAPTAIAQLPSTLLTVGKRLSARPDHTLLVKGKSQGVRLPRSIDRLHLALVAAFTSLH